MILSVAAETAGGHVVLVFRFRGRGEFAALLWNKGQNVLETSLNVSVSVKVITV